MKSSSHPIVFSALLALGLCGSLTACVEVELGLEEDPIALAGDATEISLEWLIVDGGDLISCVDAGATEIEIAVLGATEQRQRISCFGGYAVIDGLSPGPSLVDVSLVGPDGELLVTAELGEVDVVAGVTNPLGAIELGL